MNIAICEDLIQDQEILIGLIKSYCEEAGIEIDIQIFLKGEALLDSFEAGKYELVFLDIYMDILTGIETARRIREQDEKCQIIFTTTSFEHGADSYEVDAFYYLIKPLETNKFKQVMDKYMSLMQQVRTIQIKYGRQERTIFVNEILYIEVARKNTFIHTLSEVIETTLPLSKVQELLPEKDFYKPIRYCLVSLSAIKRIEQDKILLEQGIEIPISRNERERAKSVYAEFKWRTLRANF